MVQVAEGMAVLTHDEEIDLYTDCAWTILRTLLEAQVVVLGGWPGAPVAALTNAFEQSAETLLKDLGIFFVKNVDEKSACALLAESARLPVRSAVAFKSVGLNVASDTLAHLASCLFLGGALIFVGEDYGCSSTMIAERMLPFAKKSTVPMVEPKADLQHVHDLILSSIALSESCNAPVLYVVQSQVGNMRGRVHFGPIRPPSVSVRTPAERAPDHEHSMPLPTDLSLIQERIKLEQRLPRAKRFIRKNRLNDLRPGRERRGFITHGYVEASLLRVLELLGSADPFGNSPYPIYTLHCLFPLVEEEVVEFLSQVEEVLVVEEGIPTEIEEGVRAIAQKHALSVRILGRDFLTATLPEPDAIAEPVAEFLRRKDRLWHIPFPSEIKKDEGGDGPMDLLPLISDRDPQHCTGCPIRPLNATVEIYRRGYDQEGQRRPLNIGFAQEASCCLLASFAPFYHRGSMTGMGTGLASVISHNLLTKEKVIAFMGDGTFWHSGLASSCINAIENDQDAILFIIQNYRLAMTGGQTIPSTPEEDQGEGLSIVDTLKGAGAKWIRVVNPYDVEGVKRVLHEALTTSYKGPKFIISDGECMLVRQRKLRRLRSEWIKTGQRVEIQRYFVDPFVCTGDHSCLQLNGCPSLTVLVQSPNPLRRDHTTTIDTSCVGCGLCEANAHAAKLCPSFAKLITVTNPHRWERFLYGIRYRLLGIHRFAQA